MELCSLQMLSLIRLLPMKFCSSGNYMAIKLGRLRLMRVFEVCRCILIGSLIMSYSVFHFPVCFAISFNNCPDIVFNPFYLLHLPSWQIRSLCFAPTPGRHWFIILHWVLCKLGINYSDSCSPF